MDCFLKVIKGPDVGANCKLAPGINLIGRSSKAALKLSPADISWEHVSVTRNGDQCIAENLSASGSYLDDARLTGPVRLRSKDQLRLSKDTVVRFETTGGDDSSHKGMIFLFLLILTVIAVVVLILTGDDQPANWDGAYSQIETWVQGQSLAARLPADVPKMFANAWRLEQAGDFVSSRTAWLKLKMVLETNDDHYRLTARGADHPGALQFMLSPPSGPQPDPTDDQLAAALVQFVNRRLSWSTIQAQSARSH